MLKIQDITYAIDGRRLFENASATIPTGHKVGFVGPNGTGKTTLFRIIRGELDLEGGEIELPKRAKIGGVAQEAPATGLSLIETVLAADTERASLLVDTSEDPNRIAEVQTRLADIDAWSAEGRASSILKGLGFDDAAQRRPCADFSGGWRMRVALAAVLFSAPDILLLDEPTNYLDLEGTIWLESFLARYPHTVVVISHDRDLLNRAVGGILHLEDKQLTFYQGNYDTFAKTRAAKRAVQSAAAKKQAAQREHLQSFVNRFKAKASKAKQAQSRVKALERMELITPPEEAAKRVFSFPQPEELSPPIVAIENGAVGYDGPDILAQLELRIDQDDRIALLGKNGEGKSTLSKLISGRLHSSSGRTIKHNKLRIGYFAQHQVDELNIDETPLQHLQSERPDHSPDRLRAMLAGFGLGPDQVDTIVARLSGGQKARLSLLLATLDAPHLLILDEPTNHLDIESREALVQALTTYSGAVILVSHDMHLLSLVADRLWLVSEGRVVPFDHDLAEYRRFLLGTPAPKKVTEKQKPNKSKREQLILARTEVHKNEERLEKLNMMYEKLQEKLAEPKLYEDHNADDLAVWQKKFSEVEKALERAEGLWLAASSKVEKLENG
ncbi:MAG: ABC-F family ATP-binding cassette domain-containing protein, partial [Planktomarina sp.]|nr:ABC-F family ATP-binding cassette domain-containing protein [Planktomarina sp.]